MIHDTAQVHRSFPADDMAADEEVTVLVAVETNHLFAKEDSSSVVPCQDISDTGHSISTNQLPSSKPKSAKSFDERSVNLKHIISRDKTYKKGGSDKTISKRKIYSSALLSTNYQRTTCEGYILRWQTLKEETPRKRGRGGFINLAIPKKQTRYRTFNLKAREDRWQ